VRQSLLGPEEPANPAGSMRLVGSGLLRRAQLARLAVAAVVQLSALCLDEQRMAFDILVVGLGLRFGLSVFVHRDPPASDEGGIIVRSGDGESHVADGLAVERTTTVPHPVPRAAPPSPAIAPRLSQRPRRARAIRSSRQEDQASARASQGLEQPAYCALHRSGLAADHADSQTLGLVSPTGVGNARVARRSDSSISRATIDNSAYRYWFQCERTFLDGVEVVGPQAAIVRAEVTYKISSTNG